MKIPTQIWIFCVGIFLQHYTFLQKRTFCILCENFSRFVRKATARLHISLTTKNLIQTETRKTWVDFMTIKIMSPTNGYCLSQN